MADRNLQVVLASRPAGRAEESHFRIVEGDVPMSKNLPFQAAGKTGTTNDFRDNWTLGYVPELAVGVWVGNADYSPMQNVSGLTGAAPI